MNRKFKGIWIDASIWLSKELTITEKCLLAEIDSLSDDNEGCFATNQYLADFLGITKGSVANLISNLSTKGHLIVIIEDGYKRTMRMSVTGKGGSCRNEGGVHVEMKGGSCRNEPLITNRDINREKDIVKSGDLTLPLDLDEPLLEDKKEQKKTNKEKETAAAVLSYLNERALRQFPTEGKRADNNLKVIIARLRDGFTEDELKKVIDCKASKWLDEPKMKDYLKPSTLFRPGHCSDYLEEANREGTITKTSNGLVFDIDLNGHTEQYRAWWDAIKEKYPNTANEVRFFSASEFLAYQKREWFPEFDNSVGQAAQKTRTQMCLSELESSHELRRKKKSLYSALTSYHLEKCGIYEHD